MPPTDDEAILLAERVGALQTEVDALEEANRALEKDLNWRDARDAYSTFLRWLCGALLLVATLGAIGLIGYKLGTAPSAASHCYIRGGARAVNTERTNCIERHERYFCLYRAVSWGHDVRVGEFESLEAATKAAHDIGCPLR